MTTDSSSVKSISQWKKALIAAAVAGILIAALVCGFIAWSASLESPTDISFPEGMKRIDLVKTAVVTFVLSTLVWFPILYLRLGCKR